MNKRFVILDGSSLMYRAFYALPPLTDSLGEPTNAIFGFSNMLTKLLGELNPDALVIAFDKGKKTFRTERYPEYKGTRDKTPEELLAQIPLLHEFAAAFGVSFIEKERYEADDIIGTLATKAAAAGHDVMVVTGDKDALQLVRPNLRVMLTKKGISELKAYDEEVFREEYGFEPIRLIDLKGLMGDTSDNIPGVPGVGPKTATKLLLEYGTLENVLENIEAISGKKLKERLTENRDQAVLSKELATIELQVPDMELTMDDYAIMPDHAAMKKFCDRYELKGVWKNFIKLYGESDGGLFAGMEIQEAAPVDLSYDEWEEKQAAAALAKAESVAVCGIFTGRVPFEQLSRAVVVTSPAGDTGLIALDSPAGQQLLRFFEADKPATFYELKQYYHAGIKAQSSFFDIKLADYLLHPELSKYELSNLSHQYFPGQSVPESFADEVSQAVWTAKLIAKLQPKLAAELEELGMKKLYDEIELPLVEVLAAMEQNGVYVNRKNLEEKAAEVGKKIEEIQQDIYTLAGTEFNINTHDGSSTTVTLVKGRVQVKNKNLKDNDKVLLGPGMQTIVKEGTFTTQEQIDTKPYSYWAEGYLFYDNAELQDVMRKVGQMYNMTVEFKNTDIMHLKLRFFAERKAGLDAVINRLNSMRHFHVMRSGNTLFVD